MGAQSEDGFWGENVEEDDLERMGMYARPGRWSESTGNLCMISVGTLGTLDNTKSN